MREDRFALGDVDVKRLSAGASPSRDALVCFHGFPGQPPRGQEAKYANVPRLRFELVRAACERLRLDAYLPGYAGLGDSRGGFLFPRSVSDSVEVARELASRHERLHVAGHSWGGFVAVNAYRGLGAKAGKLLVYAGLLDLADGPEARAFLPPLMKDYPDILGAGDADLERAFEDLDRARLLFNPLKTPEPRLDGAALLVHGRRDTDVSVELSRRFQRACGGELVEPDDDHGFSRDMPGAVDLGLAFLR